MENQPAHPLYELNALARATAVKYWQLFTPSEKNLVRFGMFPREKMEQAEQEIGTCTNNKSDVSRLLAVALMDCAKADGGMRA